MVLTTYFNPRSSCEERQPHPAAPDAVGLFQSTLLMRGATVLPSLSLLVQRNFNPRSSCEERPICSIGSVGSALFQSTLLMRGATRICGRSSTGAIISIHAPHARSDHRVHRAVHSDQYFNPRSSCEERPYPSSTNTSSTKISIHAPHARSDENTSRTRFKGIISIHAPHARSDSTSPHILTMRGISIHAPHARSDHVPMLGPCLC